MNKHNLLFAVLLLVLGSEDMYGQNLLAIPDTLSGTNFNLTINDTTHEFYTGIQTNTFGINASYLGPTLLFRKGDSVHVTFNNQLMDTTTIHWHGMHVSAANDGGPHIIIPPGTTWSPSFTVRDHAAMYWYHPHLHMMTNLHASLGAAGLVIVRDSEEALLNLPRRYGVDDFPLVIQSKCFDATKQILINNAFDSVMLVNGTVNAYLPTPAQVVRFRLLNASSERVYNIGLQGNLTFYQIGTDGGLLDSPVSLTRLRLAPGERADILVDFTGKNGQSINLVSFGSELPNAIYGAAQPGMGPGQVIPGYSTNVLNGHDFTIMNLTIVAPTVAPVSTIPASLITNTAWPASAANTSRTLTFIPVNMGPTAIQGPFQINNSSFDMNVVNYSIPFNNLEVWSLTNQSPIAHPFHIHDVQFYITEINGAAPPANMTGRKDVVLVPAQQTVKFITKFETFCDSPGYYMYHCHMMPHEDNGMMGQFVVTCPKPNGVVDITANQVDMFPNPATNTITLMSGSHPIDAIRLSDMLGREILKQCNKKGSRLDISLPETPNGLYQVEIATEKQVLTKKLLIAR